MLEQVSDAISASSPLCIIGGNSKHSIGREPFGQPIAMNEHTGIVDYQPSELVVTARASTRLREL